MCSDCEDEGPGCSYCGDECYGSCDDPDSCPSCWSDREGFPNDDQDEAVEVCLDMGCTCLCHGPDDYYSLAETAERKRNFAFLNLPGEIRDRIYAFAITQEGEQRRTGYHRGTIHTAVLQTCRQINSEARHLPLTLNTLSFASPLYAVDFFGFKLQPKMKHLITGIHMEYHVRQDMHHFWQILVPELAKRKLVHLGLTVMGAYGKDAIVKHTCTTNRLLPLENLKTIELNLPSYHLTSKDRTECQEYFKEKLIKGYEQGNKKGKKRAASKEAGKDPSKSVKTLVKKTTSKTKGKRNAKNTAKSEEATSNANETELAKNNEVLVARCATLKQYAASIDLSLVNIRLEAAGKAALNHDPSTFTSLEEDIMVSLEQKFERIEVARTALLTFNDQPKATERKQDKGSFTKDL